MDKINDNKTIAAGWLASPWLAGTLAVLELIFGFILLSFPFLLGTATVWCAGIILGVVGIMRLIQGVAYAYNRWWNLLSGLLVLALGVGMVLLPVLSLEIFTLLLGLSLLSTGILRLLFTFTLRGEPGRGWRFFNGLVSLVLGGLVLWQWPGSSLWLIGTFIAIEMIFSGWTLLFLALAPTRKAQN